MELTGKNIVITGGASGIGRALAHRFTEEGAAHVVVADLQAGPLAEVAGDIGGTRSIDFRCIAGSATDPRTSVVPAGAPLRRVLVEPPHARRSRPHAGTGDGRKAPEISLKEGRYRR